ncbi:MAG: hypothetical protein GY861_26420, partial [bacterium]|nr:hypothetical protein [bacterium]
CDCDDFPCHFLAPVADGASKYPHNMKLYNLSVFRAMKEHGKSAPEAWEICHEALKARTPEVQATIDKIAGNERLNA